MPTRADVARRDLDKAAAQSAEPGATSVAPNPHAACTIVRLVVEGQPSVTPAHAERMLLELFADRWPKQRRSKFVLTPGGFVRTTWPARLRATSGWQSGADDVLAVSEHAAIVLRDVVTERVLDAATGACDVITIGITVMDGPGGQHAELVAVYDVRERRIARWTGKSYPASSQVRTLVQVADLDSHLLEIAGERTLVLGCHDLNMFSPRARANQAPDGPRRAMCDAMRDKARHFRPTVVLHHPHHTDTPNIWRVPWNSLARESPTLRAWASGIAFHNGSAAPRAELARVLRATRSDDREVVDIVIDSRRGS